MSDSDHKPKQPSQRSTTQVLHSHLFCRLENDIEGDLRNNYSSEVVLLTGSGEYYGHDGVRMAAKELSRLVGADSFTYNHTLVSGEYAFLEWTAKGKSIVRDGADSFVIRDGKIVMQSIHYRPQAPEQR